MGRPGSAQLPGLLKLTLTVGIGVRGEQLVLLCSFCARGGRAGQSLCSARTQRWKRPLRLWFSY